MGGVFCAQAAAMMLMKTMPMRMMIMMMFMLFVWIVLFIRHETHIVTVSGVSPFRTVRQIPCWDERQRGQGPVCRARGTPRGHRDWLGSAG